MKIKPEHYAHMLDAMGEAQAAQPTMTRAHYEANRIGIDCAKRHRWDLSYAAKLTPYICEHVYSYANDAHIDTALRAIVGELERTS